MFPRSTPGISSQSLLIFFVVSADLTLEDPKKTSEIPTESKYADNIEFWRMGTDFYHLTSPNTQIALIINLKTLVSKIVSDMSVH